MRGLDAGRGLDPARQLGATQQSGAPNIWGHFDGNVDDDHFGGRKAGAFYTSSTGVFGCNGAWDVGGIIDFDASRVSTVYQNGLSEIRPANIAANYIIKY